VQELCHSLRSLYFLLLTSQGEVISSKWVCSSSLKKVINFMGIVVRREGFFKVCAGFRERNIGY
jgi:hypothetical protein